ncbi:MAG: succinate dehydrogenase, hydrophobic membrane anchor protein [Burkholderiales bacterium]|nr:succinate dehydrogenase, hydrophobic membrane anchor protein [Burkholderiales bacterium]
MRRIVLTGLRAWLIQRASAVYMLGFVVFALVRWLPGPPPTYETWRAWMSSSGTAVAFAGFGAALLAHAWVGLRDVMMDYIASLALRVASLALLAAALLAIGAWMVVILGRAILG